MNTSRLSTKFLAVFASACLCFALTLGVVLNGGCSFLSKAKTALASPETVVSLEIVGAIVDTTMKDAAKLKVAGHVSDAQWATISADYAKEQVLYHSAVAGVNAAIAPAPSNLVTAMSTIVQDFKTFSQ